MSDSPNLKYDKDKQASSQIIWKSSYCRVKGVLSALGLYLHSLPCWEQTAHEGRSFEHCLMLLSCHYHLEQKKYFEFPCSTFITLRVQIPPSARNLVNEVSRDIITAAKLAKEILGGISSAFFHPPDNNYLIPIPSTNGLEISVYLKRRRVSEEIQDD